MKSIQNLPQKAQTEFKAIIKLLDNKDYKKGLKQVNKLSAQVDSPEVLSLKAIFLYYSDQQTEGAALAKQALFKNLKSDFCWHIYGLINKAQKNYVEAIKCFQQSLKNDNDNLQLLKDLANLQLHVRDFEGHAETRRQILFAKTNITANWIGFAVALHLTGDYQQAWEAVKSTSNVLANDQNKLKSVEENEFTLYQVKLLLDNNSLDEALKVLQEKKSVISDRLSLNEFYYQIYLRQNKKEEAEKYIKILVELQPQNWNYYRMFFKLHDVDENSPQLVELLKNNFNMNNSLIKSRILHLVDNVEFKETFLDFIRPYFQKALPSLFKEIVHVYMCQDKIPLMEEVYKSLLNDEDPTTPLWSMMLLAQHFNHIGQYEAAYEWIEKALDHTPTLHELYLVQAKILKNQKDFVKAYEVTDYVRKLDLADRYLNNKAIKYALRANMLYAAQDLIRLFLRDGNESNPHEIQTLWYELGMGRVYLRLNYYGPAFRMFKFIEKHLFEMYEDQNDFYGFAMRKYALRGLLEMVKSMEEVHNNKYFIQCAGLMISGLLDYVKVWNSKKSDTDESQKKKLTPAEKKKLQKQQQKEQEELQLKKQFTLEGHIYTTEHRQKLDLSGEQILSTLTDEKTILNEANNFAKLLVHTTNTKDKKVCFHAFKQLVELYILLNKPALALKVLNKLRFYNNSQYEVTNHKYQMRLVVYLHYVIQEKKSDPTTQEFLEEGLKEFLHGKTPEEFNKDFFANLQQKNIITQVTEYQCSLILSNQFNQDQGQELEKIATQGNPSVQELYDFIEENKKHVYERLRSFVQDKYPLLYTHFYENPNVKWQESQIEEQRKLLQHQQEFKQ